MMEKNRSGPLKEISQEELKLHTIGVSSKWFGTTEGTVQGTKAMKSEMLQKHFVGDRSSVQVPAPHLQCSGCANKLRQCRGWAGVPSTLLTEVPSSPGTCSAAGQWAPGICNFSADMRGESFFAFLELTSRLSENRVTEQQQCSSSSRPTQMSLRLFLESTGNGLQWASQMKPFTTPGLLPFSSSLCCDDTTSDDQASKADAFPKHDGCCEGVYQT
ncbi:hypothetical protein E5288_WYG011592 [Bos mutus]|uniref:Uncharacterized protein n=1 Tax=Bos mutus TaxID=72004 RepID=A0A6B0RLA5_9CETA|nr:hypothetical protein [Bos mutus]